MGLSQLGCCVIGLCGLSQPQLPNGITRDNSCSRSRTKKVLDADRGDAAIMTMIKDKRQLVSFPCVNTSDGSRSLKIRTPWSRHPAHPRTLQL